MDDDLRGLWPVVVTLGTLDATPAKLAAARPAIRAADPARVFDLLIRSRVYTLALRNLERLDAAARGGPASAALLSLLHKFNADEADRRDRARPAVLAALQAADRLGARVIKGLALREWYPEPRLRHEGDTDLHVPDWAGGLALARWLRADGWCWDTQEYSWLKWTDGGHLYGQLTLVRPDNADPVGRVDLHIGPYSVGHAGLLPLTGWRPAAVLGVPAEVPDPETALALLAAHAVNDGTLSMKDINDLLMIVTAARGLDWGSVEELCRAAHAVDALHQLLTITAAIYPDRTPTWSGPAPAPLAVRESVGARAQRISDLAKRDELARGRGATVAARVAADARRYYSATLTPRLEAAPVPGPDEGQRRRDRCWRLLPPETWAALDAHATPGPGGPYAERVLARDLVLIRSGDGTVLRAGPEVFIPTVWGGVHPASLALARTAAAR